MSRTSKSILNIITAILGQIFIILIGFISRKIFILYLDAEYLGLNGLFSSILTVLSLTELGLGPAMIFSLYKPLAENDISICKALMGLYRKAYLIIGSIVLVVGWCITPFITYLIKDIPENISGIHYIYIMFVLNAAISYFYSYKRSLITASQNQYQINAVHTAVYFCMNILQIIVLLLTHNYYCFLGIQVLSTFAENIVLSVRVDKRFPWMKDNKEYNEIPAQIRNEIMRNVKAMIFHRFGGIVTDAIDNILISKFFGLLFLGLYSNYLVIFSAIKSVLQTFFSSITASIGDFGIQKSSEESYSLYRKIQFFNFWLISFCTICLFVLTNPFVETFWLGKEYLISGEILNVVLLNFYFENMRRTILTFKEAFGLPWHDRFKPLIGAIVNLFFSTVLAIKWGVIGVFIGTTITLLGVNVWIEAYVVFKYVFHKSFLSFLKEYVFQAMLFGITLLCTLRICNLLSFQPFLNFVFRGIICLFFPNVIYWIIYRQSKEFKYIISLVNKYFMPAKRL